MHKIGDKVWYAKMKNVEKKATCPECFGKRYLTVILGDDSKVTINCAGCSSGYEEAKGYITYYQWETDVSEEIIQLVEITPTETNYGFRDCYRANKTTIFGNKIDAEKRALELAEEHNKKELEKFSRKEKDSHSWSWHVHYYRAEIRQAKKAIERYEKQLNAIKNIEEK